MLSKNVIKFVQSLVDKKHRASHGLFVVEGNKNVAELLRSKIKVKSLYTINEWLISEQAFIHADTEVTITNPEGIRKLSLLPSPQDVVAVANIPHYPLSMDLNPMNLTLALDTIQDPGNMGTIIRTADWYGISQIYCSPGCADPYSPKVIQSTMGSFTRVAVMEIDLKELFTKNKDIPVYGAMMQGKNLYEEPISGGIVLIGNEGRGIHSELLPHITKPLTIPRRGEAESLNAAMATAILCDAWARNIYLGK